ncbi:MAG: hypothetical protein DCC71_10930 [Proteobacteria bacterium]|nr:MAG: hypothetical protein DCC71_10930 [Pseudomonadota bacterium]
MRLAGWMQAAAAALLLGPLGAQATPLNVLEGTSQSLGGLTFHFTKIEEAGGLDLASLDLMLVSDALGVGFDVTPLVAGALGATEGALRDLKLEFTVTSAAGVDRAGNHLQATATGAGSSASVSELIDEAPAVDLGVFVAWFGGAPDNVQDLGVTLHTLTVTKNLVLAAGAEGEADITRLSQRFGVVPEPATAGLLLAGVAGLALGGRRRIR